MEPGTHPRSSDALQPSLARAPWAILWWIVKLAGLLLLGDWVMRLVFFAYNAGDGWEFAWGDVPMAMLVGLRFDLATLAIVNGLLLILMAVPLRGQLRMVRFLAPLSLALHIPVWMVNGADVIYYGFASKRLSHEFFSGGKEATNFGSRDMLPYWWLFLLMIVMVVAAVWIMRRSLRRLQPPQYTRAWTRGIAWAMPLVLAGLLFLAFRGGLQTRPLRPANAFVTSSIFLGNVSLNSAYTIAQSIEIGNESEPDLMPLAQAVTLSRALVHNDFDGPFASDDYPLLRTTQFAEPERKYNVVILIVESLNANKLGCIQPRADGKSLTPVLDSLATVSRLYTNFFSNGARSVQSLPAILNSTPDIFERPLIGSSFETNQHWGIGNMLAKRGYQTSFVCGGPNGTLGFDSFSKVSGFQQYFGRNDYVGPAANVASNWGLHDHPTLDWLAEMQASAAQPFLNVWFSISNHHPFDLPADCPAAIAQSEWSAMDKTVAYTDWALGQYFKQIRQQAWAANTIFVITGDHCFYYPDDPDRGEVQNFHVPLLLLGPEIAPGVDDRCGSHISILPTLMELLRLKTRYAGVGVSLLSKGNEPFGITGLMGMQTMARKHLFMNTTFEQTLSALRYADGKWALDPAIAASEDGQAMVQSLRAIYQLCSFMRRYNRQNLPRGMGE